MRFICSQDQLPSLHLTLNVFAVIKREHGQLLWFIINILFSLKALKQTEA